MTIYSVVVYPEGTDKIISRQLVRLTEEQIPEYIADLIALINKWYSPQHVDVYLHKITEDTIDEETIAKLMRKLP